MVSEMTFKEFGEFSHNQLKVMSDKSLLYYVLAEECTFWTNAVFFAQNQESVFINIAPFSNILRKT